ncbi:MAG: DUF1648 domain-containing protein, partial [Clostridia bacterium]|nr:DUF1648 domain-containing protein [Clostridia bacterium]
MRIGNTYFKVYDLVLGVLSLLVLAGASIWILVHWGAIPDAVPTHYDFSGNIDGTGGKSNILIMVGLAWFIWLTFTVLDFFPGAWNVHGLSEISSTAGKAKAITLTRTFLQVIKLLIAILFSYLAICMAQGLPESGKLITIEANMEYEETIRHYLAKAGVDDKVELL